MRNDKAPAIACLIALAILMLVANAYGATFNRRLYFAGDYDSVRVDWYKHYTDSSVFEDSVWVTSIPGGVFLAVDKAWDWDFRYMYYLGADSQSVGEENKYTAGAATVSSTDKEEIAGLVEETLKVYHGDGSWLTGTGSGSNAVRYYAVDTSGTDQAIMDVMVTMRTIADVYDASGLTIASGYRDFTAPTDSMITYGRKAGYYFPYDTNNITGSLTDTLYGYNVPLQPSPDPNLCRVQGYLSVSGGAPTKKIKVTFTIDGGVYNYCDSTAFIPVPVSTHTSTHYDSLGFFAVDLIPSGCLLKVNGDSLQYTISAELEGSTIKPKLIWVPQETSYAVVW